MDYWAKLWAGTGTVHLCQLYQYVHGKNEFTHVLSQTASCQTSNNIYLHDMMETSNGDVIL